jgi:FdhE protein
VHIDEQDQAVLAALKAASQQDPDLGSYYDYHQTLLEILALAKAGISARMSMVDEAVLRARLLDGLPLLSFTDVPLQAERFAELVSDVAKLLARSDPDLKGQTVPDSAAECLALARQRFIDGQAIHEQAKAEPASMGAGEEDSEPSLAQMSVDQALKPYLEWGAERVLPHVELEYWKRSYCPSCGGAPDLAFLAKDSGSRHLLCSRCGSDWPYRRMGCPFCGTHDHTKLSYYLGEDKRYRLYVCKACQRYLKALDLREVSREVLFPVERISTIGMDLAARQEGYR